MPQKIAVIDFGSQYTQTIARRLRGLNIYSNILRNGTSAERLKGYDAYILSGGPSSVTDADAPKLAPEVWKSGATILGICYGMQLAGQHFGCNVAPGTKREYGKNKMLVKVSNPLLANTPDEQTVWMSHGDSVKDPELGDFLILALSEHGIPAAIKHRVQPIYGVQFHPEVSHTQYGMQILKNFGYGICGFKGDWKMEDYLERVKKEVALIDKPAVVAASGGVDSTTLAYIAHDVLGKNLQVVYLDMGQGRKGERAWVAKQFNNLGFENVKFVRIGTETLARMCGLVDAKQKREVFSSFYADCLRKIVGSDYALIQGTLYPDMIESGYSLQWSDELGEKLVRDHADVIKLHHNSQLMEEFRQKGILHEPLRHLFKDEVRQISRIAGLPPEISEREPFPGPGGYVRHIGNVEKVDDFENVEAYVNEVAKKHGMEGYLFPILTVGVQGDNRTYRNMAILTGDNNWEAMRSACHEIVSGTRGVNRVAYSVTHKKFDRNTLRNTPPMPVSPETMELWREVDYAGRTVFEKDPSYKLISQMPISLLAGRLVIVRDFSTEDFMTGRPLNKPDEMSWDAVYKAAGAIMNYERVKQLDGVNGVLLDITDKPPATTEGE